MPPKLKSRTPNHQILQAAIEMVESRRLLSAVLTSTSLLTITATSSDDIITVRLDPLDATKIQVDENGQTSSFAIAGLTQIEIDALEGNDVVMIKSDFNFAQPQL